mgnify:CR=1 FL=1
MTAFSDKLRQLRKQRGLTQTEFGKLFNLSKQTISGYEKGESNPPMESAQRFADYFNISLDELMGREKTASLNSFNNLPSLTPKDEREIAKDLEAMLNALDDKSGMAGYNDPEDEEDLELLKASLQTSMRLAKQIAKKKYTPKKYRKE